MRQAIRTTCPYCGVGCGVLARRKADGSVDVKGDPDHPANFGRLCSKGSALAETLSLENRLLTPLVGGLRASWNEALDLVADRFKSSIAAHGPDSVAFYVSGQLLTEDYYVANKLMKGFIGSANIDTNSRLCMSSSVAGHVRAFGGDVVPGVYEDFELADLVVLVGSNMAWCHPVLFQRLLAAKEKRKTKIVVIDPRQTPTAEAADLHLPIASGGDVALFNGLLAHLASKGGINSEYATRFTDGLEQALSVAKAMSLAEVARLTGLDAAKLIEFYDLFLVTEHVVTAYSQGVNQSSSGTNKVNAIINCHLAAGRIGRPGMGPFSLTGQPNAMGGREVGGLANMLAAHMSLENARHRDLVQRHWSAPRLAEKPGLKAVDLFRAVADGRIKALWIMATNPVDSLPDCNAVRTALLNCPFVVVSDICRHTDTTACADVLLPSLGWGEKDGTVTNSERRISRQRAFLNAPGEARADWWQLCEVGKRMGFERAFSFASSSEIFSEHAALSAFENGGERGFDIGAYAKAGADDYRRQDPFQWPAPQGVNSPTARLFGEGGFFTADKKGRFVPTPFAAPASAVSQSFPLVLNTGRIRDQWHTMTRTGKTPRLMSHISEPFCEVNPDDAATFGLRNGALCLVKSAKAEVAVRVVVTKSQRRGSLFVPIHWNDRFASSARVDALIEGNTDPVSGQPELKFTPVSIGPFEARWHGFAVSQTLLKTAGLDYWALAKCKGGVRLELAGIAPVEDWTEFAFALLGLKKGADVLAYHDKGSGQHRFAVFAGERLRAALFISRNPVTVSRSFICEQLGKQGAKATERLGLLAGRTAAARKDKGAIVCSCFEVGMNDIENAIREQRCRSVEDVGKTLKAGTNCGSCRTEIRNIIRNSSALEAV